MITRYGYAWEDDDHTQIVLSSGPVRVVINDTEDLDVELRPVGFNAITTALIRGEIPTPGHDFPRAPIVVRKATCWWKWRCNLCPRKFGGLRETCTEAITAGLDHLAAHHGAAE